MIQSVVRTLLLIVLTWLIAHGAISTDQEKSIEPGLESSIAIILTGLGAVLWGYFEKLIKGWITASGKNAVASVMMVCLLIGSVEPMVGCAGTTTSFPTADQITATAEKIGSDSVKYTQTLANMVFTMTNLAQATAPTIEALAQQWGVLPANSTQLATFNKVVNSITNVNTDSKAVTALLTSLQTNGLVPSTAKTDGPYRYLGIANRDFCRWQGYRA